MTYRRRKHSDTWHWHPRCRWFPKLPTPYLERGSKPKSPRDLCNECKSKTKRGVPFAAGQ